jgi:pimeloyl-ACP methyl ester carboxylesterase
VRLIAGILRWLLTLIVGIVVLVFLTSVVFNSATSDANAPVQRLWHGKFVRTDGFLTAYRSWGTHGTPVILVGGFLEPSFVWERVGPLLAQKHRVYAFDLDGFGYTERHGPWTLDGWLDQLAAFERALGLSKPVVVGHSLGAAVVVTAAQRGLASRAVLLDGDALKIPGPPGFIRWALLHSPLFTSALRLAPDVPSIVNSIVGNAYGPAPHPHIPASAWTDPFHAKDARKALQGMLTHGVAGVDRKTLQSAHVRATVVFGADDNVDAPSAGRQTARDLHARFVLVPGAGHLSMLQAPAAVAAAIR